MAELTEQQFVHALASVITPVDEIVCIFSGIWAFAGCFGVPARQLPDRVLDLAFETLGPNRTILLPGYQYSFPRTKRYDPKTTKPETGVLAERFLQRPGIRRTLHPMESYLMTGPRADEVPATVAGTGWGEASVMGWLEAIDARIVVLGMPWEYCGFYHRFEEVCGVPYRYFKRFNGTMTVDGRDPRPCSEIMYVRSLNVPLTTDHMVVRRMLAGADGALTAPGNLPIVSNTARRIGAACVATLTADPYAWVKNRAEVEAWVANGKQAEMDSLAQENRLQNES